MAIDRRRGGGTAPIKMNDWVVLDEWTSIATDLAGMQTAAPSTAATAALAADAAVDPAVQTSAAPDALTVGADIAAFTEPPAAAEMALLRTFVNAVKADITELHDELTKAVADVTALRDSLLLAIDDIQDTRGATTLQRLVTLANEMRTNLVASGGYTRTFTL